jgi:tetratricopeptide (TPR) repeat protein
MIKVLAFVVIVAGTTSLAIADPHPMTAEAQAHFDRGRELYKQQDFNAALAEFERGRDLDPNPDFDYALGQVYIKLGDCNHALLEYKAFLGTQPSDDEIAHARKSMALCQSVELPPELQLSAAPPKHKHRAVATTDDADADIVTTAREPSRHWYADVAGGVLAGAGIAGLATGVAYLVVSERDVSAANSATTVAQLQAAKANADSERTIGAIALGVGGALAVGAVVRYAIVARSHREPDRVVSISVDGRGAYAVWSGRF